MKNTIKTIAIWVLVGGIFVGFLWLLSISQASSTHKNSTAGANQLTAAETLYDFGIISMKNGLVNHVFKVTNSSDKDMNLKNVSTSCMCTIAYIESASGEKGPFGMEGMGYIGSANELIKSGESRNIKVVYDPNAHGPAGVGMINRLIYLTDASGSTFQLEIKAEVIP